MLFVDLIGLATNFSGLSSGLPSEVFPMSSGQGRAGLHSGLGWVGARNGGPDSGLTSPMTPAGKSAKAGTIVVRERKKGCCWALLFQGLIRLADLEG